MKFGYKETIHAQDFENALAKKTVYKNGTPISDVTKWAVSSKTQVEPDAAALIIKALKELVADKSDFTVIELFKDEHKQIRLNICHMQETI